MKHTKFIYAAAAGAMLVVTTAPAHAIVFTLEGFGSFIETLDMSGNQTGTDRAIGDGVPRTVDSPFPMTVDDVTGMLRGTEYEDFLPPGGDGRNEHLGWGVGSSCVTGGIYTPGVMGCDPEDHSHLFFTEETDTHTANSGALSHVGVLSHENIPIAGVQETSPGSGVFQAVDGSFQGIVNFDYHIHVMDGATVAYDFHDVFTLDIWETPNQGIDDGMGNMVCPEDGSIASMTNRCRDRFRIFQDTNGDNTLQASELLGPLSVVANFNYLGVNYELLFGGLYDATHSIHFNEFWTTEDAVTPGHLVAQVNAVPNPGTLALLGLGLAGLGALRRRRQTA